MLKRVRPHLTYSNVMVTILTFAVLATGSAYAVDEWTGANIKDGTLTGADIQDLSLGLPDYGANSISTGKLKDGDVRTQDLRDLGVTNSKIGWDAISSGKVIDNNLTGNDINESTLQGVVAGNVLWAQVDAAGNLDDRRGATAASRGGGAYFVTFNRSVHGCAKLLTPGFTDNSAQVLRSDAIGSTQLADDNVVRVVFVDPTTSAAPTDFHLAVLC
jgi:hypothetical protein